MTAGTKAILLLSVVGLIVLVAWYGDGPPQGLSEQAGSQEALQAKDPLLAAATERREARQPIRSRPPSTPARVMDSPAVSRDRSAATNIQSSLDRGPVPTRGPVSSASSSPPTLEMGQAIDASVETRWQQSKWDALAAQIRDGARTSSADVASATSRVQAPSPPPAPPEPPVQSRPTTPQRVDESTHKVKAGETLGHIAQQYYGAASRWHLIADANPAVDPSSLRVGQELVIPKGPSASRSASATTERVLLPDGRTHTIGEGETLSSIAEDYLGHEKHWYRIYELNEKRIGNNPDRLVLGMVIALPR